MADTEALIEKIAKSGAEFEYVREALQVHISRDQVAQNDLGAAMEEMVAQGLAARPDSAGDYKLRGELREAVMAELDKKIDAFTQELFDAIKERNLPLHYVKGFNIKIDFSQAPDLVEKFQLKERWEALEREGVGTFTGATLAAPFEYTLPPTSLFKVICKDVADALQAASSWVNLDGNPILDSNQSSLDKNDLARAVQIGVLVELGDGWYGLEEKAKRPLPNDTIEQELLKVATPQAALAKNAVPEVVAHAAREHALGA